MYILTLTFFCEMIRKIEVIFERYMDLVLHLLDLGLDCCTKHEALTSTS
jgi:hypothetical protein